MDQIPKIFFSDKIRDIKNLIKIWSPNNLAATEKNAIIKTFFIPRIIFVFLALPVEDYVNFRNIRKMLRNLIL